MIRVKTPKWKIGLVLLVMSLLGVGWQSDHLLPSSEQASFLNDRAAEITGGRLLAVPGLFNSTGLTGKGQIVALADSGLDKGSLSDIHPDLQTPAGQMPKVVMLKSWANRETADDPTGHGTHMAATIAGTGSASQGQWQGLASGASIYFQGLLDKQGQIALPDNLTTLFQPAYEAGARIHVNAWGTTGNYYNAHARQIDSYVSNTRDLLVILASGNSGAYSGTLTNEANSKNALTVGASNSIRLDLDSDCTNSSQMAEFSSYGPTADGRIKPELLAPGTSIISAKSSLLSGNLSGYPQYVSMQGTSMAAAVAAGSAALLREQLADNWQMARPSAALMKALLIEGARTENGPSQQGFGILDLASTSIAIKENLIKAEDEGIPLAAGNSREYRYAVSEGQGVFKASLVWTDPAIATDSGKVLINDLDLIVIAPDGTQLLGNHFLGTGVKDSLNNAEQIYIANPQVGEYTIRVQAAQIAQNPDGQQFALTYGQLPASSLTSSVESKGANDLVIANGALQEGQTVIDQGYRQYRTANRRYNWSLIWNPDGVGVRVNSQGGFWYSAVSGERIGGYQQALGARIVVNNKSVALAEEDQIPLGSGLRAIIDPLTQTLQVAEVNYRIYQGRIANTGTAGQKTISLEGFKTPFIIADNAIYKNDYQIINSDQYLSAFGSLEIGEYQNLLTGMEVSLVQNDYSNKVQALVFARDTIIGNVQSVQQSDRRIMLDSGITYTVEKEAAILLNNRAVDLAQIRPGSMVSLMLSGDQVAGLAAWEKTAYGQIIFISEAEGEIYFSDSEKGLKIYQLAEDAKVIRWGTEDLLASLQGSNNLWAMLMFSADGQKVEIVKVAEKAGDLSGFITSKQNGVVNLTGNQQFYFSNYTQYRKNDFSVLASDFVVGEDIDASVLYTSNGEQVGAVLSASQADNLNPELKYLALYLNGQYTIIGQSNADAVYLWRENNLAVSLSPNRQDRSFRYNFQPNYDEYAAQLVAVKRSDGDINGANLNLAKGKNSSFSDLAGNWAEADLQAMAKRGVINGYGDGTIRPEAGVSRQEMAVILANCFGWASEYGGGGLASDEDKIAAWAYDSVYRSLKLGLMNLYSSLSFRPEQNFTRGNLADLVGNLRESFGFAGLKADWTALSPEELEQLEPREREIYGIYQGKSAWVENPTQMASRALVAAVLQEIINELEGLE